MNMKGNELKALVSLIDDPDMEIFEQVKSKLISMGTAVLPHLNYYQSLGEHSVLTGKRLSQITSQISLNNLHFQLNQWKNSEDTDIIEGALLINQLQSPDVDDSETRNIIDKIRQDIWLELNEDLTAFEKVKIMNHIIYDYHGFSGNKLNFHAIENSYIADFLTSKKGNPLTLSILYTTLAQALDVPVYGINLPNHFILAYLDKSDIMAMINEKNGDNSGILFFINPYNNGSIVHQKEIDQFLEHLNISEKDMYYKPCSNIDILNRMINNLMFSYSNIGDKEKVKQLKHLQTALA